LKSRKAIALSKSPVFVQRALLETTKLLQAYRMMSND